MPIVLESLFSHGQTGTTIPTDSTAHLCNRSIWPLPPVVVASPHILLAVPPVAHARCQPEYSLVVDAPGTVPRLSLGDLIKYRITMRLCHQWLPHRRRTSCSISLAMRIPSRSSHIFSHPTRCDRSGSDNRNRTRQQTFEKLYSIAARWQRSQSVTLRTTFGPETVLGASYWQPAPHPPARPCRHRGTGCTAAGTTA